MNLTNRFEKIVFIIQEMELALFLSENASDESMSRMLSRHVLLRIDSFIEHVRRLRRPLNGAGYRTDEFHVKKESYAAYFEEYFQTVRDKLGGHVQDMEFSKRIELWNDIEIVKLKYFVEAAKDIYENVLTPMNIPGFVKYISSSDYGSTDLIKVLQKYSTEKRRTPQVVIGSDPLAMTRANTAVVFNGTNVHTRAGQINLIRMWINSQKDLFDLTESYSDVNRVLKELIITDVVSMCDCLITRLLPPNSPQQMDGLDKILREQGEDVSPIDNFLKTYKFSKKLAEIRYVRDKAGAHVEVDDSVTVKNLMEMISLLSMADMTSFFNIIYDVFRKQCFTVNYLLSHLSDGEPLYGMSLGSALDSVKAFDENKPKSAEKVLIAQEWDDLSAYKKNLNDWFRGTKAAKGEARHFFWSAFLDSKSVETIIEKEPLGLSGYRSKAHEIRNAHQFIALALATEKQPSRARSILDLLLECRSGYPYPIAEIIFRYGANKNPVGDLIICSALGSVTKWPHQKIRFFLDTKASDKRWPVRLHAILALFKIFIRTEGIERVNKKVINLTFDEEIVPYLKNMDDFENVHALLTIASHFCDTTIGSYEKQFKDDYKWLQDSLKQATSSLLSGDDENKMQQQIAHLIDSHDYAGVALTLYYLLRKKKRNFSDLILNFVINGWIVSQNHEQSCQNFAVCLLEAKQYDSALKVAEDLAKRNPEEQRLSVFRVQLLASIPGREPEAISEAEKLKRDYLLNDDCAKLVELLLSELKRLQQLHEEKIGTKSL